MSSKIYNSVVKFFNGEQSFTKIRLIVTLVLLVAALVFPEVAQAGPSGGGAR
jgi:hypothetical protein